MNDTANQSQTPRQRALQHKRQKVIAADRNFVTSLGRGLIILECFGTAKNPWMGVNKIMSRTGLPKATVIRYLQALTHEGFLHHSQTRREYRLGPSILTLGLKAEHPFDLNDFLRPQLQKIANDYNVHASLAAQDGTDAVELEVCHSENTLMTLNLDVGSRIPIAGTATGHALIIATPEVDLNALMDRLKLRHRDNWPRLEQQIKASRDEFAEFGFVSATASWNTDINGVAVPFIHPATGTVYALACGAPARHLPVKNLKKIGRLLIDLADLTEKEISKAIDLR